jgi:hypothetical protein
MRRKRSVVVSRNRARTSRTALDPALNLQAGYADLPEGRCGPKSALVLTARRMTVAIHWLNDLDAALNRARQENKLVLLDFFSPT